MGKIKGISIARKGKLGFVFVRFSLPAHAVGLAPAVRCIIRKVDSTTNLPTLQVIIQLIDLNVM